MLPFYMRANPVYIAHQGPLLVPYELVDMSSCATPPILAEQKKSILGRFSTSKNTNFLQKIVCVYYCVYARVFFSHTSRHQLPCRSRYRNCIEMIPNLFIE